MVHWLKDKQSIFPDLFDPLFWVKFKKADYLIDIKMQQYLFNKNIIRDLFDFRLFIGPESMFLF